MRGRRQRASSPMPSSLLPCLAVRKGLSTTTDRTAPFPHCPLTTAPAGAGRHPPRNPSSPQNRCPRRPRTISLFNQVPPTKCPLGLLGRPHYRDALSPVMLLPTIMTIICLDTCQAFSRPSRPPPVLHLHSAHSLLAHCSLTRSPHSSTLPHWPQAPPMPPQRSARPMRSHILRAEECQALRPLSSATGLGHRRLAPRRHYITELRSNVET